jgi:hypothetical protein
MNKTKTTKKKLSEISNRSIKLNLMKWIESANEEQVANGKNWYNDAKQFCESIAKKYNLDCYTVATVVSCLSPNNKWERNKVDAEATIGAYTSEKFTKDEFMKLVKVCTYNANKLKAWEALEQGLEIQKSSPKTHSFAMNIARNSAEHITIDKWHLRACQVSPISKKRDLQENCTALQYRNIERITSEVAKLYSLKGYEFQAIVWLAIKAKWER